MLDSRQNVTGQLINKVDLKDAFEEAKHVVEVEVQKTILAVAGTSVSAASARASGSSASAALQAFAVLVAKTGASASGAMNPMLLQLQIELRTPRASNLRAQQPWECLLLLQQHQTHRRFDRHPKC